MEQKLWKHQSEALQALNATSEKNVVLEIPCGCGKTKIIEKQIEANRPKATDVYNVIFVPSLLLVEQTITAFRTETHNWITVTSNKMLDKYGFNSTNVDHLVDILELKVNDQTATAKPTELPTEPDNEVDLENSEEDSYGEFLTYVREKIPNKKPLDQSKQTVIISTYASADVIKWLINSTSFKINILICDEAHHTTCDTLRWMYYCQSISKIVHYTATRIPAMIEECQGKTIYKYNIRDAITDGIIHDYKIGIMLYKTDAYYPLHNDPARMKEMCIQLDKIIKTNQCKNILCFNAYVKPNSSKSTNTLNFTNTFKETTQLTESKQVFTIDSTTKKKDKQDILNNFSRMPQENYNILFNCKMISEGINIPNADTIAMLDSTKSKSLITQRLGRILRKSENVNKTPLFLIPIYINKQPDGSINIKNYKDVIQCLQSLASEDTTIAKFINGDATETIKFYNKDIIDAEEFLELKKLLRDKSRPRIGNGTNIKYKLYIQFCNANNRIPKEDTQDPYERSLAYWVSRLRKKRSTNQDLELTDNEIQALENIPGFYWNDAHKWTNNYNKLLKYVKQNHRFPNTLLPDGSINPLSTWVRQQRYNKDRLSPDQQKALDKIPGWIDGIEAKWFDTYFEYLIYCMNVNKFTKADPERAETLNNWKNKFSRELKKPLAETKKMTVQDQLNRRYYIEIAQKFARSNNMSYPILLRQLKDYATKEKTPFIDILGCFTDEPETSTDKIPETKTPSKKKTSIPLPLKLERKTAREARDTGKQEEFRKAALTRFENKCIISGNTFKPCLDAAHIIPYSIDPKYTYINIENAIILEKTLHAAFDTYAFTINPENNHIIISKDIDKNTELYNKLKTAKITIKFTELEKKHLKWHYDTFQAMTD